MIGVFKPEGKTGYRLIGIFFMRGNMGMVPSFPYCDIFIAVVFNPSVKDVYLKQM